MKLQSTTKPACEWYYNRFQSPNMSQVSRTSRRYSTHGIITSFSLALALCSFFLFLFTTLYIHNSLALSPRLKPTCFTNPIPVVSLPPGLPSRTIACTVSSELLGFCFYFFPDYFVCVSYARLRWPSRQLLSAR